MVPQGFYTQQKGTQLARREPSQRHARFQPFSLGARARAARNRVQTRRIKHTHDRGPASQGPDLAHKTRMIVAPQLAQPRAVLLFTDFLPLNQDCDCFMTSCPSCIRLKSTRPILAQLRTETFENHQLFLKKNVQNHSNCPKRKPRKK